MRSRCRKESLFERRLSMSRPHKILLAVAIAAAVLSVAFSSTLAGRAWAQAPAAMDDELILITPVAKTLTDPTLADFAKYAKEKWGVTVKTSSLAAGTP